MWGPRLRLDGRVGYVGDLTEITTFKGTDREEVKPCRQIVIYEPGLDPETGVEDNLYIKISLLGKAAENFDIPKETPVSFSVKKFNSYTYQKDGEEKTVFSAYSSHFTTLEREFYLQSQQPPMELPVLPKFENEDEVGVFETPYEFIEAPKIANLDNILNPPEINWDDEDYGVSM